MTNEYAKLPWSVEDTIENLKEIKEHLKRTVKRTNFQGKGEEDAKEIDFDFNMAIEALEKQISKKVIFEDDGEMLLCPNCNIDLIGSLTDPDHDPYYCFECGQALKWGE